MRSDRIQCEDKQNQNLIKSVENIQNSSDIKEFDYYYKRGLKKEEQRKKKEKINKDTECPVKEVKVKKQERVRAFKRRMNASIGIEAYQQILENTANMQEQQYQENKAKEQNEK